MCLQLHFNNITKGDGVNTLRVVVIVVMYMGHSNNILFTQPLCCGCDTRSISKQSKAGFNSDFFFS